MQFLENKIMKKWFPITLFMLLVVAKSETTEEKTLNLQLGFDLTQGKNGVPSLRIRDFEDSQENSRNPVDNVTGEDKKSVAVRADSDSDSSESDDKPVKDKDIKDGSSDNESSKSNNDDTDINDDKSTRGLRPGDYEPEENANVHGNIESNSDSDSNNFKRRFKRSIVKFQIMKRKGKKFKYARKPTVPGF